MRNDLSVYEEHAADWWNPRSRWFRSLHAVNRLRLELLDDWLGATLRGATVVDLGCGGGLLAEPLARRGARVLGCDRSGGSVAAARAHALQSLNGGESNAAPPFPPPDYVRADIGRTPLRAGCADLVLLADVLEHLDEPWAALGQAARLLRGGGHVYVSTIARTARARWQAVTLAEGLGLIPRGTHDPRRFIGLDELVARAQTSGLERVQQCGESLRLAATLLTWSVHLKRSRDTRVAYSALFRKSAAAPSG